MAEKILIFRKKVPLVRFIVLNPSRDHLQRRKIPPFKWFRAIFFMSKALNVITFEEVKAVKCAA